MSQEQSAAAPAQADASVSPESSEQNQSENLEASQEAEGEAQEAASGEAAASKEEKAAVASVKRKLQAKVNGKTLDIEIDPNDDKELLKYVQKALAADEKFSEASSMKKQMESFITELRKNPLSILKHPELGLDIKALAEQVLLEELEESSKSPEQKEQERMTRELQETKKALEEERNLKRQVEMQKLEEQRFQQFDNDLTAALQSSSLPKSPYVVKRIADTLIEAVGLGYEDVKVQDIMPFVESQIQSELQQMFETMPTDVLEKVVGKQHINNMRKARVAQAKSKPVTTSAIKDTGASAQKANESKKDEKSLKMSDVFGRF